MPDRPRRATLAELRRAARLATEAGVEVTLQAPDGTTYRIAPPGATLAEPQDGGGNSCDQVWGRAPCG